MRTPGCAVELTVGILGGRWRTVVLAHLKEGVHRYGELHRRMPGISQTGRAARTGVSFPAP